MNSAEVTRNMAIFVFLNIHSDISLVLFTVAYGL
jgi:hypothetical protein